MSGRAGNQVPPPARVGNWKGECELRLDPLFCGDFGDFGDFGYFWRFLKISILDVRLQLFFVLGCIFPNDFDAISIWIESAICEDVFRSGSFFLRLSSSFLSFFFFLLLSSSFFFFLGCLKSIFGVEISGCFLVSHPNCFKTLSLKTFGKNVNLRIC